MDHDQRHRRAQVFELLREHLGSETAVHEAMHQPSWRLGGLSPLEFMHHPNGLAELREHLARECLERGSRKAS
jgi:hypothetical protein